MAKKFTEQQLLSIWREGGYEVANGDMNWDWVEAPVVEEGEWIDGGKYQNSEIIFTLEGKFYAFDITRSGSYFSHYEFEIYDDVYEVEKVTKTITVTQWEAV